MKEKMKRNFWQTSEIECMLNAIKDLQTAQGNTATTHYTFVQIATRMRRRGFCNKTPTQIRRKWFQMKSAYLCYKRGNKERLLLIPERFRLVIAQFVEAEYKISNKGLIGTTNSVPIAPKSSPTATAAVNNTPRNSSPTTSTPKAQHIPPRTPSTTETHSIENGGQKPITTKTETINQNNGFYQKKIDKFLMQLKVSQNLISKDFKKMQETLSSYEHQLQAVRDAQLVAFLTNSEPKL